MNCVSLFSGIGGFDLGFERADIAVTAQCEKDPQCRKLLADKFPTSTLFDDVTTIPHDHHTLRTADIICGGFPCQDISMAGARAGLAGKRSGLWFAFRDIVGSVLPPWVVVENVPGLYSSHGGRDLLTIVRGLDELGYGVCWRCFDAQYFGLAQRRKRVFIVASLGNLSCAEVLFERESLCWNSPPRREEKQEIAPTLEGRAGTSGLNNFATSGGLIANPIAGHHSRNDLDNDTYVCAYRTSGNCGAMEQGDMTAALNTATDPSQNIVLAFTERARSSTVLASGVRRLTPTECERLQGFPNGWTKGVDTSLFSDSARYRMLGNAVAVPVAEFVGRRIMNTH